MNPKSLPSTQGYRHPPEWAPHRATWISWPHNNKDWPGKFKAITWVFAEIIRHLAPEERVRILVRDRRVEGLALLTLLRAGVHDSWVDFIPAPTDRGWLRDAGPIFLTRDSDSDPLAIADFRFNAWARYPNWQLDNRIPELAAEWLKVPLLPIEANGEPFVLEGGAIDLNGEGDLLTTEECLLDRTTQPRNPNLSQSEIEETLRGSLGVKNIIWLGRGVTGDDTHGHVDDICRFVNPNTVVLAQENNPNDENYAPLQENRERLQGVRLSNGDSLEAVPLPMPRPLYFERIRLPASYANFYIANRVVLVPTFNDPNDRIALGILAELFPEREVIGIHAVDLIWGFGAIHCLTHEEPM